MKIRVNVLHVDSAFDKDTAKREHEASVDLECGAGEQILRWVAYAACSRFAWRMGDVPAAIVPQSIVLKDGSVADPDLVLNEVVGDGEEVKVTYSSGPEALTERWEGRPRTPPFEWVEGEAALDSQADWVEDIDLRAHGIDELMEDEIPNSVDKDLKETKEALKRYAGALQALFMYYEREADPGAVEITDRMRITHFRSLFLDARVTSEHFPVQRLDDCYNLARTVYARRAGQPEELQMRLPDFLVGTVRVAAGVFRVSQAGTEASAGEVQGFAKMSAKLTHLMTDYIVPNLAPALSERIAALEASLSPETAELLAKGRRLTEQALDNCLLRRVQREEPRLAVSYLAQHMERWGYVPHKVDDTSLAVLTLFAVNSQPDVVHFPVRRHPMVLSYDEFEKLLLAIAYHLYITNGADKPSADGEEPVPFIEYLGDVLNDVYERAGVLALNEAREEI